jgi:hypothetical protein
MPPIMLDSPRILLLVTDFGEGIGCPGEPGGGSGYADGVSDYPGR